MRSGNVFLLCYAAFVVALISSHSTPKAPPVPTMVTPVSLAVAAAPEDPPVYGPCAPMNPLTQYIPFDHNGLLWSWQCYLAYKAELQ